MGDFKFFKHQSHYIKIDFNDLLVIEAHKDYSRFQLANGKAYTFHMNLKKVNEILPSFFMRIHRSYIINLQHVEEIHSDYILVKMDRVPIGTSYKALVAKKLIENSVS